MQAGAVDQFRQRVAGHTFHQLDPYVASVAGSVSGDGIEIPPGESEVAVSLPDYYAEPVEVLMGTHNGPNAPMLVLLPGIYGEGDGGHNMRMKELAIQKGMNYLVLPNSSSKIMLEDKPHYHPGNPRVDAEWSRAAIQQLRSRMPEFFQKVSVAGYSYGGLQAINLARLDEEKPERLISGVVAVCPPEDLTHSMAQFDELRHKYDAGIIDISTTLVQYKQDTKKYGYEGFMQSPLAARGEGTNQAEMEMADEYGSRDGLRESIETVDVQFGHNRLPMNTKEYQQATWWTKVQMRQEHKRIVDNMSYKEMMEGWVCKDKWLISQGLTPEQMTARYSFSEAMKAVQDTPVLAITASDDYILSPADVETWKNTEATAGPLEVVRVFDRGGHVGLDWNPEIAHTMVDFAKAATQG
jgi:pimeloyl-ACP methyl ester carboxylesterase